jgi:hypothetical protein
MPRNRTVPDGNALPAALFSAPPPRDRHGGGRGRVCQRGDGRRPRSSDDCQLTDARCCWAIGQSRTRCPHPVRGSAVADGPRSRIRTPGTGELEAHPWSTAGHARRGAASAGRRSCFSGDQCPRRRADSSGAISAPGQQACNGTDPGGTRASQGGKRASQPALQPARDSALGDHARPPPHGHPARPAAPLSRGLLGIANLPFTVLQPKPRQ